MAAFHSANSSFYYGAKIQKQISTRGWSDALIDDTINQPHATRSAVDKATHRAATAYFRKDGSYVIRDDITGRIIQISNRGDPNWMPDAAIKNPYRP